MTAKPSAAYSFSMLDMGVFDEDILYTFMCKNKRFVVSISVKDLQGEGGLVDQFYAFQNDIDDPDIMADFETWVVDAINDDINRLILSRPGPWKPTTLLEYFNPETFVFELVSGDGILKGVQRPYDPVVHGDSSPRVAIVNTMPKPQESGLGSEEDSKNGILRSILPSVPFLWASQLVRAAGPDSIEEEVCEPPRIVRMVGTGQEYFFKPVSDLHGFPREVETLAKIQSIADKDPMMQTSRIVGLVQWDGEESLLGMLLELIDGPTLYKAIQDASTTEKRKWMDQIEETVRRLHSYDIVWGDVKPDNVMINSSSDAVVIDFGGGFTTQYIEEEWQETKKGDLQGLEKMRVRLSM